jgi:hypothetical protein
VGIQRPVIASAHIPREQFLEVVLPYGMHGWMGGSGLSTAFSVLLVVAVIVAIVRMLQKK